MISSEKEKAKTLKDVIDQARGTRSITDYATACGISRANMYRLYKGDIRTHLSQDILQKLVSGAVNNVDAKDFEVAAIHELEETLAATENKRHRERLSALEEKLPMAIIGKLAASGISLELVGGPGSTDYIARYDGKVEYWSMEFKAKLEIGQWTPTSHLAKRMPVIYNTVGRWLMNYPQTELPARLVVFVIIEEEAGYQNGWVDTTRSLMEVPQLPVDITCIFITEDLEVLSCQDLPGPTEDRIPINIR